MALMERFFPVVRQEHNFFDTMMLHVRREMEQMEREMEMMRQRMHQLVPMTTTSRRDSDVKDVLLQPRVPIVEEGGVSKLKLEFNVNNFTPNEVVVKIVGSNILQVEAKHEEHTESGHSQRTYFRQYQLPDSVDVSLLRPSVTKDGVLTIEAPAAPLSPRERLIPIEYKPQAGGQ